MSRGKRVKKRKVKKDPVYNSELVQKFINKIMYDGMKSKAEKIFYTAIHKAAQNIKKEPMEVFEKALENVTPLMEVKSRRVGGATYQVPVEVTKVRGQARAMQWLREAARERPGKSMSEKLTLELLDAFGNSGGAKKKQEDMHKTAEANKAFAHFRW